MRTMIYNRDFTLPALWSQDIPADVGTIILSNGSKWGGEEADDVPALLERLDAYAVDERFVAPYFDGDSHFGPEWVNFFGNFRDLSGVFSIETRDPEVLATLKAACLANVAKFRTPSWDIKCDDCKTTIRTTTNVRESYAGGTCYECRRKPVPA